MKTIAVQELKTITDFLTLSPGDIVKLRRSPRNPWKFAKVWLVNRPKAGGGFEELRPGGVVLQGNNYSSVTFDNAVTDKGVHSTLRVEDPEINQQPNYSPEAMTLTPEEETEAKTKEFSYGH